MTAVELFAPESVRILHQTALGLVRGRVMSKVIGRRLGFRCSWRESRVGSHPLISFDLDDRNAGNFSAANTTTDSYSIATVTVFDLTPPMVRMTSAASPAGEPAGTRTFT